MKMPDLLTMHAGLAVVLCSIAQEDLQMQSRFVVRVSDVCLSAMHEGRGLVRGHEAAIGFWERAS